MSNEGESAGYIAGGVVAFIGIVLKFRDWWFGGKRQITHDENTSRWEASILKENLDLRSQANATWELRVKDLKRMAELETENSYIKSELNQVQGNVQKMQIELKLFKEGKL